MGTRSTTEKLTPDQEDSLIKLNQAIRDRQTKDLMRLVKMPEFLRYVARFAKECGVNRAIDGDISNDVLRREGRRWVGETMVAEIRTVDIEAKFQMERMAQKDEDFRLGIKNSGKKFDTAGFLEI